MPKLTETDLAGKIRETLGTFCGVLKSAEEHRGFTFITWVTRFTEASVFSALNNLKGLTLEPGVRLSLRLYPGGIRFPVRRTDAPDSGRDQIHGYNG
ncbi:MAG: AAA family ATPase [Deltaproteobacteria bacterium]|nr:AAA family ATPase [Deltaproteobacteria bacterium]